MRVNLPRSRIRKKIIGRHMISSELDTSVLVSISIQIVIPVRFSDIFFEMKYIVV